MPLAIAPEGWEHVFWAPLPNTDGVEIRQAASAPSADKVRKQNFVEVVSPDCKGLVAVACQAFHRNDFNVERVSVSRMLDLFQGSYLISSQGRDTDIIANTSRQILERTMQLTRSRVPDHDPADTTRFILSVRTPKDTGGIMAGVTALLAEHRANIVWATAAASPIDSSNPCSPRKFSAEIAIEIFKRESALQIVRIQTGLKIVGDPFRLRSSITPAASRFSIENGLLLRLGESDHDQLQYEGDDQ
jgi:predicted amino acid-binding ACT domain protein